MPKCTFCGISIKTGTGKMFIHNSGKVSNFCTNRCEKNLLKLKRKPLQVRWTEAYRKAQNKETAEEAEDKKVVQKKAKKALEKEVKTAEKENEEEQK